MKEFKRILDKVFEQKNFTFTEEDYFNYVNYLKQKYGAIPEPYFKDKECTKKNSWKNKYKKENYIHIHHIMEYKKGVDDLGRKNYAAKFPFEYQLPENLVYCNLMEHILLHLMINQLRKTITGGERFMLCTLFDMVVGYQFKAECKEKEKQQLISYFEDVEEFEDYTIYLTLIAFITGGGNYFLNENKWNIGTSDFIIYLHFLSQYIDWIKEDYKKQLEYINRFWKYNKNISYFYHLEKINHLLENGRDYSQQTNNNEGEKYLDFYSELTDINKEYDL